MKFGEVYLWVDGEAETTGNAMAGAGIQMSTAALTASILESAYNFSNVRTENP